MKKIVAQSKSFIVVLVLAVMSLLIFMSMNTVSAQPSERRAEVQEKLESKRQEVEQRQQERLESREEKTEERRVAVCERNQTKITRIMQNFSTKAENHYNVIASFQEKVERFYESGQLTVENYDELLAAVEAAALEASTNVGALSELGVELDCEDEEAAVDVGVYREIGNEVRDSLKSYRTSLVDLISAMRSASAGEDSTGSSEDEEEEVADEVEETEVETEEESTNEQ